MSMIKYLQLPFAFDAARIQQEMEALTAGNWHSHYNTKHYEGDWTLLALRALNGDPAITYSTHTTVMPYADTPLLQQCPYTKWVLEQLPCTKTSVRFMNLAAGALIKEHSDQDIAFEEGEARLHIPIQTNSDVAFYVEDERVDMRAGECWYLNLQLRHRVHNGGATNRVHLVVDCLVNDALTALFNSPAITIKKIIDAPTPAPLDPEQQRAVIAALRLQDTDTSRRMANEMEAALEK